MADVRGTDSISTTLLQAAIGHDEAAWSCLDANYRPILLSWFRNRWKVPHDTAQDLVQNVLLKALTSLNKFERTRKGQSFTGWLWVISKNEAMNHYRQQDRTAVAMGGTCNQHILTEVADFVIIHDSDARKRLNRKIHRLLELVRNDFSGTASIVFERVVIGGESAAAVASDLGMKQSAVREAKRRVLKKLRDEWQHLSCN